MGFFDLFKKKKEEQVKTTPKTTQTPPKPKTPPKPECEHGKCVKCKHTFGQVEELYFTCDEAIKCAKKQKCQENYGGLHYLSDDRLIPIAETYNSERNEPSYLFEYKAAKKLIKTYVPALAGIGDFFWDVNASFKSRDIGSRNPLVVFLVNLNKRNFQFDVNKKAEYIRAAKLVAWYGENIDINQAEWLYNPSLYESDDLDYLVEEFIHYSDNEWLGKHLLDASVVDLNQFYNEDGTIKKVGDEYEKGTIKNIISNWRKDNVNEEYERRLEICNSCKKWSDCNSKGLHPSCPAFIPD